MFPPQFTLWRVSMSILEAVNLSWRVLYREGGTLEKGGALAGFPSHLSRFSFLSTARKFMTSSGWSMKRLLPKKEGVQSGVWRRGEILGPAFAERIFRGFLFLSRWIFSPDFFSSFLWEKVPRKILQENPGKILQNLYNNNPPTHFCRLAGASSNQDCNACRGPRT